MLRITIKPYKLWPLLMLMLSIWSNNLIGCDDFKQLQKDCLCNRISTASK